MRQHVGVFTANFSSNLLWQNCFAPKKSAFCAEPRRVAAGILDVCQGGATTGLRQTRLCGVCFLMPSGLISGAYFAGLTIRFTSLFFTRMVLTTLMPSVAFFDLVGLHSGGYHSGLVAVHGDGDGALQLTVDLHGHLHMGIHGLGLVVLRPVHLHGHFAVLGGKTHVLPHLLHHVGGRRG